MAPPIVLRDERINEIADLSEGEYGVRTPNHRKYEDVIGACYRIHWMEKYVRDVLGFELDGRALQHFVDRHFDDGHE